MGWDNDVIRSPAFLQKLFRDEMRLMPWAAYARGADLDATSVRGVEDRLNAQLLQCVDKPQAAPPVWGALPRPYHQPWTRYENVSSALTGVRVGDS